ncbi:hypothetical protein HDV05_005294 [Chytridiales sp. JEL 0842]|nr:hypothetical protein HDV05_005294 [Chytridiales sp. JEL 0842]
MIVPTAISTHLLLILSCLLPSSDLISVTASPIALAKRQTRPPCKPRPTGTPANPTTPPATPPAIPPYGVPTPPNGAPGGPPTVNLPYARLTGTFTPLNASNSAVITGVNSFLGIPFSQPPVGPLRFKPPVEITQNLGNIDATKFGAPCLQRPEGTPQSTDTVMPGSSEDCLTINVWSPVTTQNISRPLPVMVWIYGGGFNTGYTSFSAYNGTNFVRGASDPVVVVTMNYRLGAFGFLASQQLQQTSGLNLGLLDQRLALLWVRKNIALFNGDAENITVFGESAGALSIAAHLVADQQKGGVPIPPNQRLFDKAILQSGGGFAGSLQKRQPEFEKLLAATNCSNAVPANTPITPQTAEIQLNCLRQVPAETIFRIGVPFDHGLVVDKWYLPDRPIARLQANQFLRVPILLGTNTDEGTLFGGDQKDEPTFQQFLDKSFDPAFQPTIRTLYPLVDVTIPPNDKLRNNTYFQTSAQIFGDAVFECTSRTLADSYAKQNLPVYKYRFNYLPAIPILGEGLGAAHFTEVGMVWNWVGASVTTDNDRAVSRAMMNYWIKFATTGTPGAAPVDWKMYKPQVGVLPNGGGARLRIDGPGAFVEEVDDVRVQKCVFWENWELTK